MGELSWLAVKAFLIAVILTPIIRDISRSLNAVDRPGQRKVHAYPIPRVGGIAIAVAYGLALLSLAGSGDAMTAAIHPAWKLVPGAALVFLVGLIDDVFSLKPVLKILGVVAAASIVFWSGLGLGNLAQHALPVWLDYPLTVFWLLLTSNAFNLIDGLDGLCAGMGLVATLTLFTAALLRDNHPLEYVTLPLVGALAGFLCYNINPATVFLGDSGALLIGFLLGCYGMIWTQKASTLLSFLVPMLALSIPLLDVSLSVLRRFLRRQPLFKADRGHIHHRLLDRGLSPRHAVLVLYLFAALTAALALLSSFSIMGKYQGFIILAFCAVALIGISKLRYVEFDVAGRLLFRGEFQRTMNAQLRLERLGESLEEAATEEEWWNALIEWAKPVGLVSIQWSGAQDIREQLLREGEAPVWSFRVPLSEAGSLQLEGGAQTASGVDLVSFAELVSRNVPGKRNPQGRATAVST